jgi:putative ABC transport system permease protein
MSAGAAFAALLSHWRRHPLQLAMLLLGLALATALWSGVQAINAEARAAYDRAARVLGQDRLDRLVADGQPLTVARYAALRQAGWPVSPVLDARRDGVRILGVDPLTLPAAAGVAGLPGLADAGAFLGGRSVVLHPETLAHPGLSDWLGEAEVVLSDGLPPRMVLADIGLAERLMDRPGEIDALLIDPGRALPGPVPAGLALRRAAPDEGLARLTDSFHLNLTAFGILAFAVGIFIVHAAVGLAFEQRRPVFRTLRAVGLSARGLAGLVMAELLVLALVAGLAGVALGYLVAAALLPDVAATLGGLYGAAVPGGLSLRADWVLAGLGMALLGTLAAAAQGLWQVWRLPLLASARPRAWARAAGRAQAWQALAGLGLLALAGLALALGSGLWAGFAVLAGLLLAAALILPLALGACLALAARGARTAAAEWFWADTRAQLPGLSLALMALLLAVAANIGVGTMVASFRTTFTGWLDQRLMAELYLSAPDPAAAAEIARWLNPRVEAVLPIVEAPVDLGGQPGSVYGVADHATYRDHWPLLQAQPGVWDRLRDGTGLLINEQMARRQGLAPGDPVALPGGALPVAGIYSDYGNPSPQAMLGLAAFAARFPEVPTLRFALRLPPGEAPALAADLRDRFGLDEAALIDQAGIKAFSLQVFERTFAVTAALNALTLGVAAVAIMASLTTLAALRLPQQAPVWAVGLTRRRLALMDLGRTLVLAALAAVLALPLGLALAWLLLAVVNVEAFGWRLPMRAFPADWLQLLAWALAAALAAGLLPALRVARTAPAALLRVFANER